MSQHTIEQLITASLLVKDGEPFGDDDEAFQSYVVADDYMILKLSSGLHETVEYVQQYINTTESYWIIRLEHCDNPDHLVLDEEDTFIIYKKTEI